MRELLAALYSDSRTFYSLPLALLSLVLFKSYKAVARKKPATLAANSKRFHQDAAEGNGLLISTCGLHPSGCHDFGATLKAQYTMLDYCQKMEDTSRTGIFNPSPPKSYYKYLFLTGCKIRDPQSIIKLLESKINIKSLEAVYFIIPPHYSKGYAAHYSYELEGFQTALANTSYKINLITTGLNCDLAYSIGSPPPIPRLELSEYKIPKTRLGLMYIRDVDLTTYRGENFLSFYFSSIANIANAKKIGVPSILVVALDTLNIKTVIKFAKIYNILIHFSDRLPQARFIEEIRQVSLKDGLVGLNGVSTLRQVLYEKGKALVFNSLRINAAYYQELVDCVSSELQPLAKLVFGISSSTIAKKTPLLDEKIMEKLFEELHQVEMRSIHKFEADKAEAKSTMDVSIYKSDVSPTLFANSVSRVAIKPTGHNTFGELNRGAANVF